MDKFVTDARLEADSLLLASWPLCDVRMMNDVQYPWFILIPRVPSVRELYELSESERRQFDRESCYLGRSIMKVFAGEKLNVAALGNVVSQLHIHHIVRFASDAAWPAPVWGKHPVQPMSQEQQESRMKALESVLEPGWSLLASD